jgi:MYXO-CTERM domain-containing protein
MIKKTIAGPIVAGVVLLGPAAMAEAQEVQTTPVDAATDDNGDDDDDDGSGKVGLLGLLGLAGLAGLAGLKRRDPVVRYEDPTTPRR